MHFFSHLQPSILRAVAWQSFEVELEQKAALFSAPNMDRIKLCLFNLKDFFLNGGDGEELQSNTLKAGFEDLEWSPSLSSRCPNACV